MDSSPRPSPSPTPHAALDTPALAAYLQARLPGFVGPLQVQPLAGGQSNPTYRLVTPGARYVLRSKPGPAARLLPSAHAIEREYRVMQALAGSPVPVPQMLLLCEDEAIIGRAFYLMSYEEGQVLWDPALPGMSPAARAAHYDEMNRVLAALHQVDVAAVGLADYGRPGNYFERQIARWSKQFLASQAPGILAPVPEMHRLIDWLPAHIPPSARDEREQALVHGDYRLDNLIFAPAAAGNGAAPEAPTRPRIAAVLDWELSTLGHPLADFSYHCMPWHIPPGLFRGMAGLDHAALGIPSELQYLQSYCQRTGRHDAQALLADWNFYLAYNLFRLASITQGIARRVVDGTASSPQAQATGASTPALAQLAWAFAQRS
jgi:aminoglycoside phosphotransferase (APT) family kinase protein